MFALPYILLFRLQRLALDARRRDRTWHYLAWSVVAGVLAALLLVVLAGTVLVLVSVDLWWLAVLLVTVAGVPLVQSQLMRHVVVPRGWYRFAFWLGHVGTARDSDADALAFSAWAQLRSPSPAGETWIAARRDRRKPLGDAEIVTTALLAAGRGDVETARRLLRSTLDIVEHHPLVRELAGEWLACDAAERGAWNELAADAAAARFPATPLTYLLEAIAAVRGGGGPSRIELYARWLIAPHRRTTFALLAAAGAPVDVAPPIAVAIDDAPDAPVADGLLPRAIAAQLALGSRADAKLLAATVAAWDAALADADTRAWLARRALELDAPLGAAERAVHDVAAAATDQLARIADARTLGAPPARGAVGEPLARRLRHGRLDALEAGFSRWADRRHDGTARVPVDEWREFVALRGAYESAVAAGGLELRRLAFPHAYKTGVAMAVWLWNARDEYALSHAISAWLAGEALAVGDSEAIDVCNRNARLAVPTRNGKVTTA
ncbi:MAG TPA: hypothetical protein VH143_34410 [Kofleriaceae bacterium]|jgi:hypothetical protein|nr:hypothetical protein [Kofleriaceae bacterium]